MNSGDFFVCVCVEYFCTALDATAVAVLWHYLRRTRHNGQVNVARILNALHEHRCANVQRKIEIERNGNGSNQPASQPSSAVHIRRSTTHVETDLLLMMCANDFNVLRVSVCAPARSSAILLHV